MATVKIYPNSTSLAYSAAEMFVTLATDALRTKGKFTVALSGGSTPRLMYQHLAEKEFASQLDWPRIHVFWSDERCVPPQHPDSNYKMAWDVLLSKVPVSSINVHRMADDQIPAEAARTYERTIRDVFDLNDHQLPHFDLILLGIGEDGHTASLFPGNSVLDEEKRLVVATYVEKLNAYRITLTPPVLKHAINVMFLVSGANKAEILQVVLEGPNQPRKYPAQLLRSAKGNVIWLNDQAAASRLNCGKDNK